MEKSHDSASPGQDASFFMQTTEDVAKAAAAVTSAAAVRSPRPSVVFSSRDEYGSQFQKLQHHVARVLKGLSPSPEVKRGAYNPEILTSQKRQWARFQLQSLDHRSFKEPSRLFESMVVVGLSPNVNVQALQCQIPKGNNGSMKSTRIINQQQVQDGLNLQPQVLFVYPPEKELPLKYKDLLSFCLPGGVEEQLKQSDLSFVFRLQVADDSTLYGCCVLVEEMVQKPSRLVSVLLEEKHFPPFLNRHIMTTPRCYCILSRLPFFSLHFDVLRSIFTEERLERLTNSLDILNQLSPEEIHKEDDSPKNFSTVYRVVPMISETGLDSKGVIQKNTRFQDNAEMGRLTDESESCTAVHNAHNDAIDKIMGKKQPERLFPEAVLPLLRFHQCESFESSGSFQGSPDDRKLRSDTKEQDLEEPSSSDKEHFYDYSEIRQWAKANNHGSLQIICEYYQLQCPTRGSMLTFQPLEHLHSLEFHRHGETAIHISGSTFDLRSCRTSLEVAEAQNMLLAEEEAAALSVWTVACLCGSLRLEHVLMIFSGALLEKQIVVASSNMGILSASVLSVVPLIRPYQWQSLLMPVLPNDMLDFLDAPVPYIVGIMNMTSEVQSKLMNAILVDADKNQVRSTPIPCLPQHKELFSSLSPYYAKLVGESYLARKRPVYKCTDVQVEAAKSFLAVLRSYLNSLCSNLRSHTITNVQSNDDKVSLLLKESFIASFPSRDRPFMKLFVDTQLFSVHTDLVLSLYQKD